MKLLWKNLDSEMKRKPLNQHFNAAENWLFKISKTLYRTLPSVIFIGSVTCYFSKAEKLMHYNVVLHSV